MNELLGHFTQYCSFRLAVTLQADKLTFITKDSFNWKCQILNFEKGMQKECALPIDSDYPGLVKLQATSFFFIFILLI